MCFIFEGVKISCFFFKLFSFNSMYKDIQKNTKEKYAIIRLMRDVLKRNEIQNVSKIL